MSTALLRMQIAAPPATPGLPAQYDQAHTGHSQSCEIPSLADSMRARAQEAYAAAHPTTTTTSTTSTTTAPKSTTSTTSGHHRTTSTTAATKPKTVTTAQHPTTTTIAKPAGPPGRAGVP